VTTGDGGLLHLTKLEGAGNDFLVALDPTGAVVIAPGLVRVLCDRRRGIGADGVIRVGPGRDGADVSMELWNADGRPAEMSGNGIRCLAQAAVDGGLVEAPTFDVATAAGVRRVTYTGSGKAGEGWVSVEMGVVGLGDEQPPPPPGRRARAVDVGNPHLVVWVDGDLDDVDVAGSGRAAEEARPGGVNVEFVGPGEVPGELALRVWERGVGETLACGTGTCAAAAVARAWGIVGDTVRVRNPGGTLEVDLGPGDAPSAVLAGPVRRIADVVVDPGVVTGDGGGDRKPAVVVTA
jgi:diaminopimelate epimerase